MQRKHDREHGKERKLNMESMEPLPRSGNAEQDVDAGGARITGNMVKIWKCVSETLPTSCNTGDIFWI